MSVGRNSPCACGSGRKSKHCCVAGGTGTVELRPASPAAPDAQRLPALKRAALDLFNAGQFHAASAVLADIVRLQPASADAHHDLGVAHIRSGHFAAAAESFRAAVKYRPNFRAALEQLARALEYQSANAQAADVYDKLARIGATPQQKLLHVAKAQQLRGELDAAEATLGRLLRIKPDGYTRSLLGNVLVDQGKFAEAAQEFRLALATHPAAFHRLATTQRMTEADRPLLDHMRAVSAQAECDPEDRTLILYGLGKAFDDLHEHEAAIGFFDAANALRRRGARFDRLALARRYDAIIARYNAASFGDLSAPERPGHRRDGGRPIFIVGMPRSGTTLVEQVLSSHPAVTGAGELQYWRVKAVELDRMADGWRNGEALSRARDDYLAILDAISSSSRRVTDKAPLNFETLGLIMSALPDCRIIHCRRQPIDTCLSIYFTEFAGSLGFAFDRSDIAYFYRQYLRLMAHWRRVLPAERFLEVDYEHLVTTSEAQIRRLVAFSGLAWDDRCLAPEQNDRVVKTASLWQARQPIYTSSVERWRRYMPWLGELADLVTDAVH